MLPGDDQSLPAAAHPERHQQLERLIGVAREAKGREAGLLHHDAEFLVQLADQRLLRALARLDLAAGKLPEPRELLTLGPLGDEDAPVGIDEGAGGDEDKLQIQRTHRNGILSVSRQDRLDRFSGLDGDDVHHGLRRHTNSPAYRQVMRQVEVISSRLDVVENKLALVIALGACEPAPQ